MITNTLAYRGTELILAIKSFMVRLQTKLWENEIEKFLKTFFRQMKRNFWCHNTQHNDTQHNDTNHNDIQHDDIQYYIQFNEHHFLIQLAQAITL